MALNLGGLLRPTGRRRKGTFTRRTGRRNTFKRRRASYATPNQITRIPRTYFNPLPAILRTSIRLQLDDELYVESGTSDFRQSFFAGFMPLKYVGLTNSPVATHLLALMSIYGKCAVLKTSYSVGWQSQSAVNSNNVEIVTGILPYYDAVTRFSPTTVALDQDTFNSLRQLPGSHHHYLSAYDGGQPFVTDRQDVDTVKFLGMPMDTRHCTLVRQGLTTNVLAYPRLGDPAVAALPTYVWALRTPAWTTNSAYFGVRYDITFHCEFSSLRIPPQTPDDVADWTVTEQSA